MIKLFELVETVVLDDKSYRVISEVCESVSSVSSALLTGKKILRPEIKALHEGITSNGNEYMRDFLMGMYKENTGVNSWTYPYNKPVLKNHDVDGEPLGRVMRATCSEDENRMCMYVYPEILDEEAIEKIEDGRYLTVSVKADTDKAICSICGVNWAEQLCFHMRNSYYVAGNEEPVGSDTADAKKCTLKMGNLWFKEISFVNNPSDNEAMVSKLDCAEEDTSSTMTLSESVGEDKEMCVAQEDLLSELSEELTNRLEKYFETMEGIEDLYFVALDMSEGDMLEGTED